MHTSECVCAFCGQFDVCVLVSYPLTDEDVFLCRECDERVRAENSDSQPGQPAQL